MNFLIIGLGNFGAALAIRYSSHVSRQQLCQAFAAFISSLFLR